MIIVKKIEIEEVPDNIPVCTIQHYTPPTEIFYTKGPEEKLTVTTEDITGNVFINNKSERVLIGWSEHVQKALGLPFTCFKDQKEYCAVLHNENIKLHRTISSLKNQIKCITAIYDCMTFWDRIKFLFKKNT